MGKGYFNDRYWFNRLGITTVEAELVFCINHLDHLVITFARNIEYLRLGGNPISLSTASERYGVCQINIKRRWIKFFGHPQYGYSISKQEIEKVLSCIENYPEYLTGFKFIFQADPNTEDWQVLNYNRAVSQKIDKRKRA